MIVIYPLSPDNVGSLDGTALLLNTLGPNATHRCLILAGPSVMAEAQVFHEEIAKLFAKVELIQLPDDWLLGSQAERNRIFRFACEYLLKVGNDEPFIWMEHCCPMEPGWLDNIAVEYKLIGRPYIGDIQPTYWAAGETEDGKPLFRKEWNHMRAGVYWPGIVNSNLLQYMAKPFELALQHEIAPNCAPCRCIKTIWASANFETNPSGRRKYWGEKTFESDIRQVALVYGDDLSILHGCRDGTLEKVVTRLHGGSGEIKKGSARKSIIERASKRRSEFPVDPQQAAPSPVPLEDSTWKPVAEAEEKPAPVEKEKITEEKPAKPKSRRGRPRKDKAKVPRAALQKAKELEALSEKSKSETHTCGECGVALDDPGETTCPQCRELLAYAKA